MGQSKQHFYRNGGSSGMNFLSPHAGTSSVPMNAKKTLDGKASGRSPLLSALPYAVGVFGLAFLASCITASIMTPVQNSDATTQVDIHSNQVAYFVNIATAGSTISKDVQATYTGTLGIIPDTLTVTSNTPDGYKVYLSMAHDDPVASKQRLVNTTDSSSYFNPISSGSLSAPSNLSTANTWGVAVASTYNSAFDNATSYTDATVSQTTKFAPVPAYGAEELLITRTGDTSTQDGTGTTDTIPVYYGYHANSALPSGTYSNTVMYTAYAEASSEAEKTAIVSPSKVDSYKTPQRLSFTTTLYTDRTIANNQASVKINDLDCTDVQVSKVGGGNDTVTISCLAPAQTRPGTYSAVVSVPDYGHVSYGSVDYDTPGITATVAGVETTITEMQEMTPEICEAWTDGLDEEYPDLWDSTANAPKAFTTGEGPVFKYGSNLSLPEVETDEQALSNWSTIAATANSSSGSAISNINASVPETFLYDNRDNNLYRVRKLADGNCWMTENLRLVFADDNGQIGTVSSDGTTISESEKYLSSDDTNITSATSESFKSTVARTEVKGVLGVDHTVWGALSTGDTEKDKHPTDTTTYGWTLEASNRSMTYSRSAYTSDAYRMLDGDLQIAGSYYNWRTATASTGTIASSRTVVEYSICPIGWQLPDYSLNGKSFTNLIYNTYGGEKTYNADNNPDGLSQGDASTGMKNTVAGAHIIATMQALRRAPISLAMNGRYHYNTGNFSNVSYEGLYWTRNAGSAGYANYIYFSPTFLYLDREDFEGFGISIRCVAQ